VSGYFLDFSTRNQGQRLSDAPIAEPQPEQNCDSIRRTYMVQHFQNARLEYHSELLTIDNKVRFGLL